MKFLLSAVLVSVVFIMGCSTSEDVSSSQPIQDNDTSSSGSDTDLTSIPMSDSHENGRFFLISHTSENGIESVDYIRKGNDSDSYGRMKIKCSSKEMKKYSVDNLEGLNSGDLGSWYTPAPDWTDKDIFNFICK